MGDPHGGAPQALVLTSTSYLDEADGCDRLVYLDRGRVAASGTPAELQAAVHLDVYRAWGDDARAIARAARALDYVAGARATGRFARIEVRRDATPDPARVLADLRRVAGGTVRFAEAAPPDMESAFLAIAEAARRDADHPRPRPDAPLRRFHAVDKVDITVAPGAIFAFLGANGSGKSTTIRMLIGLLRPDEGTVEVDGIDVIAHPRRVRDRIGYMGQRVSLYQGLTLRENVEFYAGLYGLGGADLEKRWDALRARFALGEAEREKTEDLPAGIRQRAGLALSIMHRPRVVFLDEPTAGVDVRSRGSSGSSSRRRRRAVPPCS
jgi:ABC-2 type transport system ATP-binding protein